MRKKSILIIVLLLMLLLIPFKVEAEDYQVIITFFSEGGEVNTGNVEIINNVVFTKDSYKADVKYNPSNTIKYLNSLDKKTTFTLKKNGKAQAKNQEWYGGKQTDNTPVYFSNSEKYKVQDLIKKLGIDTNYYSTTGEPLEIFLYANYSEVDAKNIAVKSVKLNASSKEVKVGDTYTLNATITPSDATIKDVTYKSSDTKVATVDSTGKVKGVKEGNATITVTTKDGNKTDTIKIKVVKTSKESEPNKVIIKYNVNGGKLASEHKSTITVKSGYILNNGSDKVQTIEYKESTTDNGLANYANPNYINIEKDGYVAESGAEWNTKADGSGKSYSQSKEYKAKDFCDASKKDCTVTLYVNWKERNKIYFLETGTEGSTDSILLVSGKKYGLIDTSQSGSYEYVSQQLEKLGVKELEFLQYTHMHTDHIGDNGLYLGSDDFKIKKLFIKADGANIENMYQSKYQNIINKAKKNNIEICDVKKSSCNDFYLGKMHLKLYNTEFHKPDHIKSTSKKEDDERDNDDSHENLNSIVTLATIHGKKIYLTGDIGNYDIIRKSAYVTSADKQETVIAKKVGKVDVYKVAHHGNGKYNGYPDLVNGKSPSISILKPKYSIFTAYKNKSGKKEDARRKKRKAIEEELKDVNSKLYYTGNGTVAVNIDESGNIKVSQKKQKWWK